jgi:hypothetical protein
MDYRAANSGQMLAYVLDNVDESLSGMISPAHLRVRERFRAASLGVWDSK